MCTQVRRSNYLVPEEVLVGDILERPREDEVDELLVVLPLPLLPRSTFPVHLRHPADPWSDAPFHRDRSLLASHCPVRVFVIIFFSLNEYGQGLGTRSGID